MAVSLAVYEIFNVKEWRDLDNWVRSCSKSFKMSPFDSFGTISCTPFIVTMALSYIVLEIKRDIGRKSRFFHTPFIAASFQKETENSLISAILSGHYFVVCYGFLSPSWSLKLFVT